MFNIENWSARQDKPEQRCRPYCNPQSVKTQVPHLEMTWTHIYNYMISINSTVCDICIYRVNYPVYINPFNLT